MPQISRDAFLQNRLTLKTQYTQWRRNEFESGGTGPERKWGGFFGRAPPLFLALKAQLVVLVSAFVVVSTVWSVSCLLF